MPATLEKPVRILLLLALVALVVNFLLLRHHELAGALPLQTAGRLLAAVSAVVLARVVLLRRAREERLDFERERSREEGRLFQGEDDLQLLPAVRTSRQAEQWLPPVVAPLLGLFALGSAWVLWPLLSDPRPVPLRPLSAFAILGGEVFVFFLLSQYLGALARDAAHRLLRAAANLAGMMFVLAALAATGALLAHLGRPEWDVRLARAGVVVVGLLGLEWCFNAVSYWYRAKGVRARVTPYESRLAGLFGDPGALLGDLAKSLDYQFGVGFSTSWFSRFLTRALLPLAAAQVALLWISSAVVWLEPHETGLRERFGRLQVASILSPGLHFKYPYPFERVRRFPSGRVLSTQVGYEEGAEAGGADPDLFIWTAPHYAREDVFLTSRAAAEDGQGASVSMLNVNVPIQYRITNVVDYARHTVDPSRWLHNLAYRSMTRLCVNRGLEDLVGEGQTKAGEDLRDLLQREADRLRLGVAIEFVALHGAHPPLLVAAAYEKAVGARQDKETIIQRARGEAHRIGNAGIGEAETVVGRALTYYVRRKSGEQANSERFAQHLAAFAKEPDVYRATLYFNALERALQGVRTFIIPAHAASRVFNLNLEDPPDPSLFEFHDPNAESPSK